MRGLEHEVVRKMDVVAPCVVSSNFCGPGGRAALFASRSDSTR